ARICPGFISCGRRKVLWKMCRDAFPCIVLAILNTNGAKALFQAASSLGCRAQWVVAGLPLQANGSSLREATMNISTRKLGASSPAYRKYDCIAASPTTHDTLPVGGRTLSAAVVVSVDDFAQEVVSETVRTLGSL